MLLVLFAVSVAVRDVVNRGFDGFDALSPLAYLAAVFGVSGFMWMLLDRRLRRLEWFIRLAVRPDLAETNGDLRPALRVVAEKLAHEDRERIAGRHRRWERVLFWRSGRRCHRLPPT